MKYVEQYDVYIDNDLVIYRRDKNDKLKTVNIYPNAKYLHLNVKINGKWHSVGYHRVIATAFIPNPEGKPTVDHIDRNPRHNSIENLRWATHKEQALNRDFVLNPKYANFTTATEWVRVYRSKNPDYVERHRQWQKHYNEEHREYINERQRKYNKINSDVLREKRKLYYEKNRERIIQRNVLYKQRKRAEMHNGGLNARVSEQ